MFSVERPRRFGGHRRIGRRTAAALFMAFLSGSAGVAVFELTTAAKKRKNAPSRTSKNGKQRNKGKSRQKGKKAQRSNGSGDHIVRVAQKYKGAKYVWGGASPRGFDCSGFTWFVYKKATGMDIGRTVKGQWKLGNSVGRGDWRPGDIVFFENTFERGLSHCGIYIGGGRFIHAENERTGVVVSDLQAGYYDDHYAGARRLV